MAAGDNAESQQGFCEKKMESEEIINVRTVDCLRGRLLAERMASRKAKEEADTLGNKMVELEKLLGQEAKSRKRAEKRLTRLMNKLQSLNITYTSDESSVSEWSCLVDKSGVSSVSSTTKDPQEIITDSHQIKLQNANLQPNDSNRSSSNEVISSCCSVESEIAKANEDPKPSSTIPEKSEQNMADEKSNQMGYNQSCCSDYSKMDDHSDTLKFFREEEGIAQEDEGDDDGVDNSMALVPVEVQQQQQKHDRIDPQVLDNTVREVLDALKYAKEQLQNSMERQRRNRNLIKVG